MRHFVQLTDDGIVSGELYSARVPGTGPNVPAHMVEVTGRTDGPYLHKKYSSFTRSFADPPADIRPLVIISSYDPAFVNFTAKMGFSIGEPVGLRFEINDGKPVGGFSESFTIPLLRWDPAQQVFTEAVRRLKLDFAEGVATKTLAAFMGSGDFGFDQRVSTLVRIPAPFIFEITE